MQVDFPQLRKVEVELKRLATSDRPPPDTGSTTETNFQVFFRSRLHRTDSGCRRILFGTR